ncbi:MAG: SRPBCC domain-containing protein [Bacteroidetes bacterium]|nr:SRPBCC domain-containing protein [Bacteroidota bacterium]
MAHKTILTADDGKQDIHITRVFDLPLELLFKAFSESALVEQWMGTKVLTLENRQHGGYRFETTDPRGNKHRFHGVIHEYSVNTKIIRTFEIEGAPFGAQLEYLEFEQLTAETSKLLMQTIFRSNELRDHMLQLPFAQGISSAHNRLQDIVGKLYRSDR